MSTTTRTGTATTTITAGDVRQVMADTTAEITTILKAAAQLAPDFDVDRAMVDCSLFALNDILQAIHLELYLADELVREYRYVIGEEPMQAQGPPADKPPLGTIPAGARVRLTITHNPSQAPERIEEWLRRLGWSPARPLRVPEGVRPETYGTFVCGGYGVERQLLANPKFDRPAGGAPAVRSQKEG
jgi:hypothetical protein